MKFALNRSVRQKQLFLIMGTTMASLLLACAAFVTYEVMTFRSEMVANLSSLAGVVGNNVSAAIDFNDAATAGETLSSLRNETNIDVARVFDRSGEIFAEYIRPEHLEAHKLPAGIEAGHVFYDDHLYLFHPVVEQGEVIGRVLLISNLEKLGERIWRYVGIVVLVLLVSLSTAFFLSTRLERFVSAPILQLAGLMRGVAEQKDYTRRATKISNDEIGQLVDGFNEMLAQIAVRDAHLEAARRELEDRVAERTVELQEALAKSARERARFKFIFDAVPVGFTWMIKGDLATRMVNPAHAQITGVPVEECCDLKRYRAATHPDDQAKQEKLHHRLEAGEIDHYHLEKRYIRPDGSVCWTEYSVRHFQDSGSGEIQEISTVVDISERKQAEAELDQIHKQLLQTSRQAGMAEVASGVLHNVGNVLNSINVSVTLVTDSVRKFEINNLSRVVGLLRQHESDLGAFFSHDPKAGRIPGFLEALAEHMGSAQEAVLKEVEDLRKNVEHIKDIVAMQQSYAKVSGVAEEVAVIDLVEDAIRMNAGALTRHDIHLVRDFQSEQVIEVEKHKVLQILVNLIRNAKYACDDSGRPDKQMIIRTESDATGVKLSVIDNGVGIPPENLTRIFSHGFTTRKTGHGFGLHSGALAAKELGGALHAHSDGPGCGARFVLELPRKTARGADLAA